MRSARNGGVVVPQRAYPVIGDDRSWTTKAPRPHLIDPKENEAATETAMAAAFARAMRARDIDTDEVPKLKDADAREIFTEVRWAETDGRPTCPSCGAEKPYVLTSMVGKYKCRNNACASHFSATSRTMFASRKSTFQNILLAVTSVTDQEMTATRLAALMGVTYKTAWTWGRRLGLPDGRRSNVIGKLALNYPYMPADVSAAPGADLLTEIVLHLPPGLPQEMREDVSQELALAVLCGDVARADLASAVPSYMRAYNRMFRGKYGERSLDAVIPGFDRLTLGDTLSGENSFEYWERR